MKDNNVVMQIDNLCKTYGSHEVLKDVSLTISKGDVIAIIGPSGCGKSTFIRMLNLLERPTSGKIYFEDRELTSLPQNTVIEVTPKIGMVSLLTCPLKMSPFSTAFVSTTQTSAGATKNTSLPSSSAEVERGTFVYTLIRLPLGRYSS